VRFGAFLAAMVCGRFESCGPAAGLPGPVRGPSSAGPPTLSAIATHVPTVG